MDPLVSIVLPTYNGSRYIRQSIESCLGQTYENLELIIVDDCSTDNTMDIIKSYGDGRVRIVRHEKNMRLPESLNTGFSLSKGRYLTWTSDDNCYAKDAIKSMLGYLQSKKADFVYCDYFILEGSSFEAAKRVSIPDTATFRELNFVRACFLYSRDVKEAVGKYSPEAELSEDYDYWIRVSKKFILNHLKEPLYYYRVHPQALYTRRYWEQEAVKCLVRFRHGLFSENEAAGFLFRLFARKKNPALRLLFYLSAPFFFTPSLRVLLSEFQEQSISFTECKNRIMGKAQR
ncbi:MAG: glycosyltransferase [Candidatus Omnitrophica bacterium]|nr:glycosyltransferase [Candidatus Omnitrophota bacterium]